MRSPLRHLRIWTSRAGLWPTTRFARVSCYILGIDLLFYALKRALELAGSPYGESLGFWVTLLGFVAFILFLILAYRWMKANLLWRLRNRLIVTYVFIGVIPVILLISVTLGTMYLFAGQFANFLVTSQLQSRLRNLEVANSTIASQLAVQVERGNAPLAESLEDLKRRDPASAPQQLCVWYDGKLLPPCGTGSAPALSLPSLPAGRFAATVLDQGNFFLRAAATVNTKGHNITVISSQKLDQALMEEIVAGWAEISLDTRDVRPRPEAAPQQSTGAPGEKRNSPGFTLSTPGETANQGADTSFRSILTAGILPLSVGRFDREISFGTPLSVTDWRTGKPLGLSAIVRVFTRPAALYVKLFASDEFANTVEYALFSLLAVLVATIILALVVGTTLTRTVTRAIAQLYLATRHINQGDFSHRIPVKSHDQLSTLAHSFNSMSESLQKLMQEQKEKQKLENELVIAQEVQAQLFPQQISQLPTLEVHGFCRPARTVSGDYYDFLRVDSNRMVMAVGDVSGKGISAALLMATIHSAVRAYSLEGIPILRESVARADAAASGGPALAVQGVEVSTAALLTLLNHQLYESTPTEKYATMFLSYYDGRERSLTYTNAGHLPPLVLGNNGTIRRLDRGGTVVGLFESVDFEEGVVQLADGDIFLAYSDGVTEPENDYGEFGEQRLIDLVWENRQLPLEKISEIVTAALDDWIGANEQPDDVTLVLARAR